MSIYVFIFYLLKNNYNTRLATVDCTFPTKVNQTVKNDNTLSCHEVCLDRLQYISSSGLSLLLPGMCFPFPYILNQSVSYSYTKFIANVSCWFKVDWSNTQFSIGLFCWALQMFDTDWIINTSTDIWGEVQTFWKPLSSNCMFFCFISIFGIQLI